MAKGLEGMYRKSLDADVERKGAKEIDWDTYSSYDIDDDSPIITTIDFDDDIDRKIIESDGIARGLLESEEPEPGDPRLQRWKLEAEKKKLIDELFNARIENLELYDKIDEINKKIQQAKDLTKNHSKDSIDRT